MNYHKLFLILKNTIPVIIKAFLNTHEKDVISGRKKYNFSGRLWTMQSQQNSNSENNPSTLGTEVSQGSYNIQDVHSQFGI